MSRTTGSDTSANALFGNLQKTTAQAIRDPLARAGVEVYDQSDGSSRTSLLDSFKASDSGVLLGTRSFWEGVDRVATIATEKTRAVKMALENDKVTLSVTSPDNGTAAEEVPADYGSQGFEIGFNANYLKDILGQIEGDTVELHLADAGAPTLIRQDEKSPALYVLMPMRV